MAKNFEIIFPVDQVLVPTGKIWTEKDILDVVTKHNCLWALVEHTPDEGRTFRHRHLGIHTDSNNDYETIAKWFGLNTPSVQKIKGRFEFSYLLYLIHYGQTYKTQFSPEDVKTNFTIDWKALKDRYDKNKDAKEIRQTIISNIANGTWRAYNLHNFISPEAYAANERQIKAALKYRDDVLRETKDRSIDCIFIEGPAGYGKTSLAKDIARRRGLDFYVSDSGKDFVSDYGGEPCLILDDFRPSDTSASTLLKLLDPNTGSSVASRYRNKVLDVELIIVTSSKPVGEFFYYSEYGKTEELKQFLRRLSVYIVFKGDLIQFSVWNGEVHEVVEALPNPYYKKPIKTPVDLKNKLYGVLTGEDFPDAITPSAARCAVEEALTNFRDAEDQLNF